MRGYILFISILFQAVACLSQKTISREFMHDNLPRNYKVYLPAPYTGGTPWPVVYSLHGYTMTMDKQINVTDMNSVADTANFLIVYPQGLIIRSQWPLEGLPGMAPGWNYGGLSETDDFGFLSSLMDTIENNFNIDRNRVYLVGFSNGAQMSYALTCKFPERIAAVAGVVGKMVDTIFAQCTEAQAKPVLTIHGTTDACVDYYEDPPALATINFWRELANCDTTPAVTYLPDVYPADSSTLTEFVYSGCTDGIEIVHLRMNDGGHQWPGRSGPVINGQENFDIDGSSYVWRFLRRFSLTTIDTGPLLKRLTQIDMYPNPSSEYIILQSLRPGAYQIEIHSSNGQLIFREDFAGDKQQIDMSRFIKGVYVVTVRSEDTVVTKKIIKL